jgi:hypothetical protein
LGFISFSSNSEISFLNFSLNLLYSEGSILPVANLPSDKQINSIGNLINYN